MINLTDLLASLDNDEQLLADLIETFVQEVGPILEQVLAAARTNDHQTLERAAHKLKGSLSIFGDGPALHAAATLELIGRAGGGREDTGLISTQLEKETKNLSAALEGVRHTLCAG